MLKHLTTTALAATMLAGTALTALAAALAARADTHEPPRVRLQTTAGDIVLELAPARAPGTAT